MNINMRLMVFIQTSGVSSWLGKTEADGTHINKVLWSAKAYVQNHMIAETDYPPTNKSENAAIRAVKAKIRRDQR